MNEIIIFILIFSISCIGVDLFRRWSLRREILDIPNERSSHTTPTPRGGGIIIVSTVLMAYAVLSAVNLINFKAGFFIGSLIIALISWLDDLFTVSFIWRFIVHSIAASIFIYTNGYFKVGELLNSGIVNPDWIGIILTYLWIVWLTNAYNFMDGIDGIAGIQAVAAGIGWFLVANNLSLNNTALTALILTASSLGFLIHNWQPAKIFMGDVGSAFLGYCFAVIPLIDYEKTGNAVQFLPFLAIVPVWFFLFDTVYTFTRRLLKKKKVWEAHREHLYQQLVIDGFSHRFVTLVYGSIAVINSAAVFLLTMYNEPKPSFILPVLFLIGVEAIVLTVWVRGLKKRA